MSLFDLQKPEVTTVIRWLLRVILVVFLAWLVKRRPDQEDEEDEQQEGEEEVTDQRDLRALGRGSAGIRTSRNANPRTMARMNPRTQQPFQQGPASLRQRRAAGGDDVDFDAVISKISKPKEMWEVRKSGEKPQIFRRQDREQDPAPAVPRLSGDGSARGATGGRVPLTLAPPAVREEKGKEKSLRGHERPVTFILWNRDCNLLFTCGKDKIVCVWSCPEGELLGSYSGHSGAVWACSVTADSRWLVTSGADRLVIVWEARTSRELARVELPGVVRFVEWAGCGAAAPTEPPTSERFVTCHNRFGSHPAAVSVWRFDEASSAIEQLLTITTLPTAASQVRWGLGDDVVASSHDNGELCFWRADTGAEVKRLQAQEEGISRFDFSVDRELVATASKDKTVLVWDLGRGSEWKLLYKGETDRPLNAVALGPLTHSVATGAPGQRPSGCTVIAAGGQDVRDVALSGNSSDQFGTLLFSLGSDEELPGKLTADGVTKGHFGPVHTLAFALDGSAIASGSEDGCVRIHIFDPAPAAAGDSKKEAPQDSAAGAAQ